MLNGLYIPVAAVISALLFTPPIALTRIEQFSTVFWNSRLGKIFSSKPERDSVEQVTIIDLMAAALNSGMSIPAALRAVELSLGPQKARSASALPPTSLTPKLDRQMTKTSKKRPLERDLAQVAASLLMGASWEEAWENVAKKNLILFDVLAPAWEDGAAPVPLLERTSATLRLTHQSRANEAAGRLGARLVAPLALCFLPAFMLIGVVPIVVLAARQIF